MSGKIARDTNREANSKKISVNGILAINCPITPDTINSPTNIDTVVSVPEISERYE